MTGMYTLGCASLDELDDAGLTRCDSCHEVLAKGDDCANCGSPCCDECGVTGCSDPHEEIAAAMQVEASAR